MSSLSRVMALSLVAEDSLGDVVEGVIVEGGSMAMPRDSSVCGVVMSKIVWNSGAGGYSRGPVQRVPRARRLRRSPRCLLVARHGEHAMQLRELLDDPVPEIRPELWLGAGLARRSRLAVQ
jgi:hypothetical protein